MAKISKGITMGDIDHIRTWYLSNDMLQANDAIIELTETLGIPKLFRNNQERNHTASDGQKFNTSVRSELRAFVQILRLRARSKPIYVLRWIRSVILYDGNQCQWAWSSMRYRWTDAPGGSTKSDIHSTDTFGYSEVVFALTHLLKLVFAPRIKNFKEQQLYAFEPRKLYKVWVRFTAGKTDQYCCYWRAMGSNSSNGHYHQRAKDNGDTTA